MTGLHYGYTGLLLRVNLSSGSITTEPLDRNLVEQYIGGRGLAARILYDELAPGIDPLGPDNKMIFLCGPLAGTLAQSCSRWIVTTKSPQTGGIFRASAGGGFGAELKAAGYDALIVEGRSPSPVYLWIDDGQAELCSAENLSGMLTQDATAAIRAAKGDRRIKVAVIGPAGEKLVRFAAILDERRSASRGGVGAVMGSKNLKAVAVRGSKRVGLADRDRLLAITKQQAGIVKNEPRLQGFRHLGTAAAAGYTHQIGLYPVKNFQVGVFPAMEGKLTGAKVDELFVGDVYCRSCPIHCGSMLQVKEGPYAGEAVEGPEYETLYSFGGELGNADLGMVIEANRVCDDYGVDTMSAGATIGFAMECYERGIMNRDDLDGIELTWGSHEAIMALLRKIVTRDGVGDLLAEGSRRAAERIGNGAERYAMQVKGLELPGYDPRGGKGAALNLATAPLGASHCVGQCPQEMVGSGTLDRFAPEGKGAVTKFNQDKVALFETGVVCIFPMMFRLIDFDGLKEMLYAVTGIKAFQDEEYLKRVGERILNVERAFNVREGFGRADDVLPSRFTDEAQPEGPIKDQVVELEIMLDEYYDARGWDRQTGYPTRSRLAQLGLETIADDLERIGRLG